MSHEFPKGDDSAAPAQIPSFEQVLFLGFEKEEADALLRDLGRGEEAMIFVGGKDWEVRSWAR